MEPEHTHPPIDTDALFGSPDRVRLTGPDKLRPCELAGRPGNPKQLRAVYHNALQVDGWSWAAVQTSGAPVSDALATQLADAAGITFVLDDGRALAYAEEIAFTVTALTPDGEVSSTKVVAMTPPDPVPLVPVGPLDVEITSPTPLTLRHILGLPGCPSVFFQDPEITWTADPPEAIPPGIDTSKLTLTIPGGTLLPGTTAVYTMTALELNYGGVGESSYAVTVARRDLRAIITPGGAITVPASAPYTLSAAGSYDEDVPAVKPPAGATFAWSCRDALGGDCGVTFPGTVAVDFPADTLPAGPYTVTVQISTPDGRQATDTLQVNLLSP